jgi:DNA-binding NtrC family response regulator
LPQLALGATRVAAPAIVPAPEDAPQSLREAPPAAPMILEDAPAVQAVAAASGGDVLALIDPAVHIRPLDEIEAEVIRFAIARYRGQMSEVARRLRIGRSTLYRKLDEIGLGAGDARDGAGDARDGAEGHREGGENVAGG